MSNDILSDEVLAEIERVHGDGDVDRLLRHARALQARLTMCEASRRVHELDNHHNALACGYCAEPLKDRLREVEQERDEQRLIYAHMVDSGEVQQLVGNAIEAFRQRAVEAVRAKRAEWWAKVDSDGESNRAAWMHHSDAAGKLINLIESLPATTNEEVGQ